MFQPSKGENGFQKIGEREPMSSMGTIVVSIDGNTVGIIGDKTVKILRPDKEAFTFEHHEGTVYNCCIKDDTLYMVDSQHVLTQWNINTGIKISETQNVYRNIMEDSQWTFTDDIIYLNNRICFYTIERSTGKVYSSVPGIIAFDQNQDLFYILSEDNRIMVYDHYDNNDIVRKLKNALEGVEYDDLLKMKYGLSD